MPWARDADGYWLVHNRIPILAAPTLLRRATLQQLEDIRMNDLFVENMRLSHRRRSTGGQQHGFLDLSQRSSTAHSRRSGT